MIAEAEKQKSDSRLNMLHRHISDIVPILKNFLLHLGKERRKN